MSAVAMTLGGAYAKPRRLEVDFLLLVAVTCLLMLGVIMVA